MGDDLVKQLREDQPVTQDMVSTAQCALQDAAADRIEELEAENKLLNEQMTAIEEMGTESLNALPDCLMRLAPALVENDDLKAKLAKAVCALHEIAGKKTYADDPWGIARTTLAELKGQDDE